MNESNNELEVLLSRIKNAKRVTNKLVEKSKLISNLIIEIMQELGVRSLMNNKYRIKTMHSGNVSHTLLLLDNVNSIVALNTAEINSEREKKFMWNDFNCAYQIQNRDDVLMFLNDAKGIINELAEMDKEPENKQYLNFINFIERVD